jgi:hypothetical protein
MTIKRWFREIRTEGEIIACFGQARLVRKLDGKSELIGGSEQDRLAAREWISMFWNDVVVRERP